LGSRLNPQAKDSIRRYRLRTWLGLLVIIALLPILGLTILAVWQVTVQDKNASKTRLLDSARALARSVENDIIINTTLLKSLAAASYTHQTSIEQLQSWLDHAQPGLGRLYVVSPHERLTPTSEHDELPPAEFLQSALDFTDRNRPVISNLYFTSPLHDPKIALGIAWQHASIQQVLYFVLSPRRLLQLAPQLGSSETSLLIAIVDGNGNIIARSRDNDRYVGQPVPDWEKLMSLPRSEKFFEAKTKEGSHVIFSYEFLAGTPGWVLVVGEPLQAFDARWKKPLMQLGIGGGIMLLLALWLTSKLSGYILRPMRSLAKEARGIIDNKYQELYNTVEYSSSRILEFDSLHESIIAAQTALKLSTQQAENSELKYRTLAHTGALTLWEANAKQGITSITGWQELTGAPNEHALRWNWIKRVHPEDVNAVRQCLSSDTNDLDCEFRILTADQTWHWVRAKGSAIPSKNTSQGWIGTLEDIHERRKMQEHVAHLALHDDLTKLPNRTALNQHLQQMLSRITHGHQSGILFLDLDYFKEVNDTHGHETGDALLTAVSARLSALARDNDFIARLGGDEFVVVCSQLSSQEELALIAKRIILALSQPFNLQGLTIHIGVSIGITLLSNTMSANEHLKQADIALYKAKENGKNCYVFHHEINTD